jgi:hypothetical protein
VTQYWVIGGEYESTEFKTIAGGGRPQRMGPFASYEDALAKWADLAWQSVDNCNIRFHIESESDSRAA